MSKKHPLIVVTGSSGAGTSTVKQAFQHIFIREGLKAVVIEGDSYHKYNRVEMRKQIKKADKAARTFSHFGPEANLFERTGDVFQELQRDGDVPAALLRAQCRRAGATRR